jgi:hypothetical protein
MLSYRVVMTTAKAMNLAFIQGKLPELRSNPLLLGKFVVVNDKTIKAQFDTFAAAIRFAVANFPADEFIIQEISAEESTVGYLSAAS